jgi:hypothetical protein
MSDGYKRGEVLMESKVLNDLTVVRAVKFWTPPPQQTTSHFADDYKKTLNLYYCRLWSSRFWHHMVLQVVTNASEEYVASTFNLKMEAIKMVDVRKSRSVTTQKFKRSTFSPLLRSLYFGERDIMHVLYLLTDITTSSCSVVTNKGIAWTAFSGPTPSHVQ